MSPSVKSNNPLRDKLDDDTLDLSLSQMNEVSEDVVRDIVSEALLDLCSVVTMYAPLRRILF